MFVMLVFPSSPALAAGFFFRDDPVLWPRLRGILCVVGPSHTGRRDPPQPPPLLKVPRSRYAPALTSWYNPLAGT